MLNLKNLKLNSYNVVDFEEKINIRVKSSILETARRIQLKNQDRYSNLSHYIRCAIFNLNNLEEKRLNRLARPKK